MTYTGPWPVSGGGNRVAGKTSVAHLGQPQVALDCRATNKASHKIDGAILGGCGVDCGAVAREGVACCKVQSTRRPRVWGIERSPRHSCVCILTRVSTHTIRATHSTYLGIRVPSFPKGLGFGWSSSGRGLGRAERVVHTATWRWGLRWRPATALFDIADSSSIDDSCCWRALAMRRGDFSCGRRERTGWRLVLLAEQEGHGVGGATADTVQEQSAPLKHASGLQ